MSQKQEEKTDFVVMDTKAANIREVAGAHVQTLPASWKKHFLNKNLEMNLVNCDGKWLWIISVVPNENNVEPNQEEKPGLKKVISNLLRR